MPTYEGIGIINEKNAVILEIGKALTKAGFSGEPSPRCIIPSTIRIKGMVRALHDFKDPADLYQMLVQFLHGLYCKHLLVTAKERKVVVVDSLFSPSLWRQTLARVLYLHYEVQNVLWLPSSLSAAALVGDKALILDFGAEEVQVIPVYGGVTLLSSCLTHELGAGAFDRNLKSVLLSSCLNKDKLTLDPLLTPEKVEDIRIRACVVTSMKRANFLSQNPLPEERYKSFQYELDGGAFLSFHGSAREVGGELWFQNSDPDGISVPRMVLDVLNKCPIDTRRDLAASILVTGGTGMMPGLNGRLLKELQTLSSQEGTFAGYEFKIYDSPPGKSNTLAWLGGAAYGGTEAFTLRGITKEYFLKNSIVPDWCNINSSSSAVIM